MKRSEPTEKERFTVLMEEMQSTFKVVIEHVGSLNQKFDHVRDNIQDIHIKIDDVKKAVISINEQFIPIQFVLSDHEHRIKKMETVR